MTRNIIIETNPPNPNGHLMLVDTDKDINHRYAIDLHAVDCSGCSLLTDSEKDAADIAFAAEINGKTLDAHPAPEQTFNPLIDWSSVRSHRNNLLRDTDWQAGTDVTMSDAQKAYRKKLRDLPATNSDPTKIVFPDAP